MAPPFRPLYPSASGGNNPPALGNTKGFAPHRQAFRPLVYDGGIEGRIAWCVNSSLRVYDLYGKLLWAYTPGTGQIPLDVVFTDAGELFLFTYNGSGVDASVTKHNNSTGSVLQTFAAGVTGGLGLALGRGNTIATDGEKAIWASTRPYDAMSDATQVGEDSDGEVYAFPGSASFSTANTHAIAAHIGSPMEGRVVIRGGEFSGTTLLSAVGIGTQGGGDYSRVTDRLFALANGGLPLTLIANSYDYSEGFGTHHWTIGSGGPNGYAVCCTPWGDTYYAWSGNLTKSPSASVEENRPTSDVAADEARGLRLVVNSWLRTSDTKSVLSITPEVDRAGVVAREIVQTASPSSLGSTPLGCACWIKR